MIFQFLETLLLPLSKKRSRKIYLCPVYMRIGEKFRVTVEEGKQTLRTKQMLKKSYMVMQDVNHQLFTESVLDEVLLSIKNPEEASARHILDSLDLYHMKEVAQNIELLKENTGEIRISNYT